MTEEEKKIEEQTEELKEDQTVEEPKEEETDQKDKDDTKSKKGKKETGRGREFLNWVLTILIALVVTVLINIYIIRISSISGQSMENSYHDAQVVMVSRLPYIFSTPKHGDVIVFDAQQIEPGERTFFDDYKDIAKYNLISTSLNKNISIEHKYYIKRVIGVPGDTIEIKEDGLYRNGELIQESYIKDQNWIKRYNATKENWEIYSSAHVGLSVKVSEGCVFVMGDNRLNSKDSRVIGEVSYDAIIGKVLTKGKTNDES